MNEGSRLKLWDNATAVEVSKESPSYGLFTFESGCDKISKLRRR